jgi:uncharacterized protein (DUF433 family)
MIGAPPSPAVDDTNIYAGRDPSELPLYRVRDAARYLSIPPATLRAWVFGQSGFSAVLERPDPHKPWLSFFNLVEAHVLDALRREHKISLQKVRNALSYLARKMPTPHPLADPAFTTNGLSLFLDRYGELINLSREGQLGMRSVLEAHLKRIDRDPAGGMPLRLFPFTRRKTADEPKMIVIDPRVAFGRPVIVGTGIPTAIIAQRYKAGESIAELSEDYERPRDQIEEAIRTELAA